MKSVLIPSFFLPVFFPHLDWIWENTDQRKLHIWTLFTQWLVSEAGLSDHHKMITAFIKLDFSRLRPKLITYTNYKKFHEVKFLNYLKEMNIRTDPNQKYQSLTNTFSQTCSFKKENYENYPTIIHKKAYKRQRNLCVSLKRKNIKSFLNTVTIIGITTNKFFWTSIKRF